MKVLGVVLTVVVIAIVAFILLTNEPTSPTVAPPQGPPTVYTTFYPTTYFVQRIAGDRVRVVCPVPADEDAIFWMPDDATIQAYQRADLIVINGAGFEKWVEVVSLPTSRIVDTAGGFTDRFIYYEATVTHQHGPEAEHTHEGLDGHTWVDPVNAAIQAGAIRDALARILPAHAEVLEQGYTALAADLGQLDDALRELTGGADTPTVLASHPAYNYVAARYGWNIINLDLDPEQMPDDAALTEIGRIVKQTSARHIIWEAAPLPAIADRLESSFGLVSVEFSPCELLNPDAVASGSDYLTVMHQNIEDIRLVFTTDNP